MFEDQSQKIYDTLVDKVNSLVAKKPLVSTVVISAVVSIVVLLITLDYKKGEASVGIYKDTSTPAGTESGSTYIKVDLSGAVKNPGVYELAPASRLTDLLALSGGFISEVSSLWVSKNLNLSQKLADGAKIYIPFEWDIDNYASGKAGLKPLHLGVTQASEQTELTIGTIESSGATTDSQEASSSSVQSKINVNTASASDLDLLPGIGPAYAGRIMEHRPYVAFDDFKEKSELSANLAESLKELIVF